MGTKLLADGQVFIAEKLAMPKTLQVAADRAHGETKTVLPAEVARGATSRTHRGPNRSKAGRKIRRDGTAETVAVAFPATGGISYSPHWLALKRAAGCNKDNELIASDFRHLCRHRGIALAARNIEKLFSDFCAKVGQV